MSEIQAFKRNVNLQQWTSIIADRTASGLTIEKYCEKNQISRNSYYYWLRRIRSEMVETIIPSDYPVASQDSKTNTLVELVPHHVCNQLDSTNKVTKIPIIEDHTDYIEFAINGITITVKNNISDEQLTKIMRAAHNA